MTGPRIPGFGRGLGHDDAWQVHARCRDTPTEMFFPRRERESSSAGADAKAVCSRCPVLIDCLGAALAGPRDGSGIWAGCAIGGPVGRRLRALARVASHGPVARAGCRCVFCLAVSAHQRGLRRAFDGDGEPVHGRWETFVHAGCRCGSCSRAQQRRAGWVQYVPGRDVETGRWLPDGDLDGDHLGGGGDAA